MGFAELQHAVVLRLWATKHLGTVYEHIGFSDRAIEWKGAKTRSPALGRALIEREALRGRLRWLVRLEHLETCSNSAKLCADVVELRISLLLRFYQS